MLKPRPNAGYRPIIARRMANGDPVTLEWLKTARFHKIGMGPSKGTWIAWRPGKCAALPPGRPRDMGADWWEHPCLQPSFQGTINVIESMGW